MQNNVRKKLRKSASQVVLSRMQLSLHATHRTPHRALALGARDVCLAGDSPTWLFRDARVYEGFLCFLIVRQMGNNKA